eukprot:TRINITY_DN12941_c0_g1_i1.p1 TRINITY_DN12941_c0_g1~~TRINITY_DN12941_c0_g1_i1.p1  ORF type:complete len:404 (-),score=144.47 TRINITY_DN12941_c0_g1_i1:87-1298(-)
MSDNNNNNYIAEGSDFSTFTIEGKTQKLNNADDVAPYIAALQPFTGKSASPKPLTSVKLSGNTFAAAAIQALAATLKEIETLTSVNASDIFVSRLQTEVPPSILAFSDALRDKEKLTELDLSDNALGPSGAKALGTLISTNHSIRTLRVNNDGLGQDGGKHIAAALLGREHNGTNNDQDPEPEKIAKIETFVCGRNRLENPGAEALSKTFQAMKTLTALQIPQNGIRPEGITSIAAAIKANPGLKIVDLNDNTIKEKGAIALAEAFSHLTKLQKVNLGDCLIGTKGAIAIAKALEKNEDLEELDLTYNEISDAAAIVLAKALSNKTKLKKLELNGNKLKSEGIEAIKSMLEQNKLKSALGSLSENDEEDEEEEGGDDGSEESEGDDDDEDTDAVTKKVEKLKV